MLRPTHWDSMRFTTHTTRCHSSIVLRLHTDHVLLPILEEKRSDEVQRLYCVWSSIRMHKITKYTEELIPDLVSKVCRALPILLMSQFMTIMSSQP